jgi:hypothetical protein
MGIDVTRDRTDPGCGHAEWGCFDAHRTRHGSERRGDHQRRASDRRPARGGLPA